MQTERRIIPSAKQLAYQDLEFGLFIHFGLRTFYEGYADFDERVMTPAAFNPEKLDCEQWIRTAKEAGMEYAVLTAKHHDGFSNWPSKYSSFTTAASPWQDGQGDVVREFVNACRKYDVKPGLYYSPYDGSADFYTQDAKAYDDYFVNQITELLSGYGDIDILWFDGCGSEDHTYDWPRIIGEIRRMQPNILIFNMGDPDFRWIGNEDGIAPTPCWNVVESTDFSIYTDKLDDLGEQMWLPAECDVQMRANNSTWFYSDADEHLVKSVDELMGLYYLSVGRGTNLLLNIGPNREGLLPAKDADHLTRFGEEIRRRFSHPIASTSAWVQEGNRKWQYRAEASHLVDHIIIEEDLTGGERVRRFTVSIISAKSHRPVTMYEGSSIGHKAIIRIPTVKAAGIIVEITECDDEPILRSLSVHYAGGDI